MRQICFVDSSALIARFNRRDQWHARSVAIWKEWAKSPPPVVTSNAVVVETIDFFAYRHGAALAAKVAERMFASRLMRIVRSEPEDDSGALAILGKFGDQDVSYTDCLSFAIMKRLKIQRVFGFDRHFAVAGFELWPD